MNHQVIQRGSKTVIAMAHVPALPGAPDYDSQMGMQKLHDWVVRDVEALQTGEDESRWWRFQKETVDRQVEYCISIGRV